MRRTAAGTAAFKEGLQPENRELDILEQLEEPALFRRHLVQIVERLSRQRGETQPVWDR